MLSLLASLLLAQAAPSPQPQLPPAKPTSEPRPQPIVQPQRVRPLPGQLDSVPVFNSNNPELVETEGILLSTFPPAGKRDRSAHLNFPLRGRFDIFTHHVFKALAPDNLTSMYLGVIAYNPGSQPVTIDILQAASYLSQPDAPFISLPSMLDNAEGNVYAGPGSRAMSDVLRGRRQALFPAQIVIPPGQYRMLMNLPIPVATLTPPLNGRSTLMRLHSSGTVYLANLALLARKNLDGSERAPSLEEWQSLLETGQLAARRDEEIPTPLNQIDPSGEHISYGRVGGIAQGSRWQATLTDPDRPNATDLTVPEPGQAFSYGLSTLSGGRMGSGQIQSARMVIRYPHAAYQAHGNYGIEYDLSLPLHNPSSTARTVTIALQTPIKFDQGVGLSFFEPLPPDVFFRGTVRVRYVNDRGLPQTRYYHLVQHRGEQGQPLATITLPPNGRRLVEFSFLYPPDSTPPQVLTVQTLPNQTLPNQTLPDRTSPVPLSP